MSIKDRIEAARESIKQRNHAGEEKRKQDAEEAKKFFAPVYEAFLEIEKEYGNGKGLKITVTDYMCTIRKTGRSLDKLELSCFDFCKDKIHVVETMDFSIIPDSTRDPIVESSKYVNSAEEAIKIAIDYIGENLD